MKKFELEGSVRTEFGKKANNMLRKQGLVPCELYGGESSNVHLSVKESVLNKLVFSPEIFEVVLSVDGKTYTCVLKDLQFHPTSDRVMHVDFLEVVEDKPIEMNVPVVLKGLAPGVKAGGRLNLNMRKLRVSGLCKDIPETLVVSVDQMKLGQSIKVAALSFPNIRLVSSPSLVVCTVKMTRGAVAGDEEIGTEEHASEAAPVAEPNAEK